MQAKALPPEKKRIKAAVSNSDKIDAIKVSSPCTSICQMDAFDDFCLGCYRTRAEIATWGSMDQDDQIQLLDVLRDRRAKVTARCGVHRDLVKNVW